MVVKNGEEEANGCKAGDMLSGPECPYSMVYKEEPVLVLPLHLPGSQMPLAWREQEPNGCKARLELSRTDDAVPELILK